MCQRSVTVRVGSKFFINMKVKVKMSLCHVYQRRKGSQYPVNTRLNGSQSCREDIKFLLPSRIKLPFLSPSVYILLTTLDEIF